MRVKINSYTYRPKGVLVLVLPLFALSYDGALGEHSQRHNGMGLLNISW